MRQCVWFQVRFPIPRSLHKFKNELNGQNHTSALAPRKEHHAVISKQIDFKNRYFMLSTFIGGAISRRHSSPHSGFYGQQMNRNQVPLFQSKGLPPIPASFSLKGTLQNSMDHMVFSLR